MKKKLRIFSLILLLLGYFCFLTCISYLRAPAGSLQEENSALQAASFRTLEGAEETTGIFPEHVVLQNAQQGELAGCVAELSLAGVSSVQVNLTINCAEEQESGTLTVDLCAEQYDRAEQERQIQLKPGKETVSLTIEPGENAPDTASLRFFTYDRIAAELTQLDVRIMTPKDAGAVVRLSAILTAVLLAAAICLRVLSGSRSLKAFLGRTGDCLKTGGKLQFTRVFTVALFVPLLLSALSLMTGKRIDAVLKGNFSNVTRPSLTAQSLWDGSWQQGMETWWNEKFCPRGVAIKTYNQIRYSLFREGNRIIGKGGSIFEPLYIETELALTPELDFSRPENQDSLKAYVDSLNRASDLLEKQGIRLVVYTTPSKAAFDRASIPDRYLRQAREGAVNAITCFREMRDRGETAFVCIDSSELLREHTDFPVFYKTGIHWSRPAEQFVSQRVMQRLETVLESEVPQIELGELESSKTPYWRDSDVYDLLNVWSGSTDSAYYQFGENGRGDSEQIGMFIVGGSFAMGLEKAAVDMKLAEVDYLNYTYGQGYQYIRRGGEFGNNLTWLHAFDESDFQMLLDRNDVLVLEMNESVIPEKAKSDRFLNELLAFLQSYSKERPYIKKLQFPLDCEIDGVVHGFYSEEQTHIWSGPRSWIMLKDAEINDSGLELRMFIPDELPAEDGHSLHISVNDVEVLTLSFSEKGYINIVLPPELLQTEDGFYHVSFEAEESFCPLDFGNPNDNRVLSFALLYAGAAEG